MDSNSIAINDIVRIRGGEDKWEVIDVTHQHYQLLLGDVSISVKKQEVELVSKAMTDEDRYSRMVEALKFIRLNDWSSISGAKSASEFAEETLIQINEMEED